MKNKSSLHFCLLVLIGYILVFVLLFTCLTGVLSSYGCSSESKYSNSSSTNNKENILSEKTKFIIHTKIYITEYNPVYNNLVNEKINSNNNDEPPLFYYINNELWNGAKTQKEYLSKKLEYILNSLTYTERHINSCSKNSGFNYSLEFYVDSVEYIPFDNSKLSSHYLMLSNSNKNSKNIELNIYVLDISMDQYIETSKNNGGIATIPQGESVMPWNSYSESIVLFYSPFIFDWCLTHEMGHWAGGLYHVFDCDDEVDDTPRGDPDIIKNYLNFMNYGYFAGKEEEITFSAGQMSRFWKNFISYKVK